MRKFYKTTFVIEVLSEDEPIDAFVPSLSDIEYMITEGHCSGSFYMKDTEELTGPQMAEALMDQGSDPEFFGIDEDGNIIEDDDSYVIVSN